MYSHLVIRNLNDSLKLTLSTVTYDEIFLNVFVFNILTVKIVSLGKVFFVLRLQANIAGFSARNIRRTAIFIFRAAMTNSNFALLIHK